MGTRADFYVGRGPEAVWLGSIAFDGHPRSIDLAVRRAKTQEDFLAALERFFSGRDDVTRPADGWPWPWEDSGTTDYAYAFDGGQVWGSCYGAAWFQANRKEPEQDKGEPAVFPNMKGVQAVTIGRRSGILLFTPK